MMTSEYNNAAETIRKTLASIDVQRKALEMESEAIYSELMSPPPPMENDNNNMDMDDDDDDDNIKTKKEPPQPMGINTPLVDSEGYPRADIDIYRARTLRKRFHEIQTDHKGLMKQTEELLIQLANIKNPTKVQQEKNEYTKRTAPKPKPVYDPISKKWVVKNWDGTISGTKSTDQRKFDSIQNSDINTNNQSTTITTPTTTTATANDGNVISHITTDMNNTTLVSEEQQQQPFARVNGVASLDSPAGIAGLKENDLILQFGPINSLNHNNLRAIADYVPTMASTNQSIKISIKRSQPSTINTTEQGTEEEVENWDIIEITLVPKPWSGRGLIGCHIVPYYY